MKLESLKPAKGSVKNNTRLGRGQGSGGGGTAKRGHKGAKSRSGFKTKKGFEGGQMPLQRRVPKFGFNNINRIEFKPINLDTLQALYEKINNSNINLSVLKEHSLISKSDFVKVLGRGELKAKVNVVAHAFSKSAIEAIEKAGGTATIFDSSQEIIIEESAKPAKVKKEEVAEEVKTEKPAVKKSSKKEGDDLTKIEGIGPKIAALLAEAGIDTFAKLANTPAEEVSEILKNAGSNFASHNPATWGEQSQLAADGKWDELKELQDRLMGGRPE